MARVSISPNWTSRRASRLACSPYRESSCSSSLSNDLVNSWEKLDLEVGFACRMMAVQEVSS